MLKVSQVKQKNALSLAYLGDAIYESLVREYIMEHSDAAPGKLHRLAVSIVCAEAQSGALAMVEERLTAAEQAIIRRGKNATHTAPKSAAPKDYRAATALEALFGYLYMLGEGERIRELFRVVAENQIDAAISAAKPGH